MNIWDRRHFFAQSFVCCSENILLTSNGDIDIDVPRVWSGISGRRQQGKSSKLKNSMHLGLIYRGGRIEMVGFERKASRIDILCY